MPKPLEKIKSAIGDDVALFFAATNKRYVGVVMMKSSTWNGLIETPGIES